MRALTKTGIRILSAKYRSILIKCAIINASVFVGAFGVGSAMAADITTWTEFKNAVNSVDTTINVTENITYDGTTEAIQEINRSLSIIGNPEGNVTNVILDGKYSDVSQTKGLTVGIGGDLILTNIDMKNFGSMIGGTIQNKGNITGITGNFSENSASLGGAILNNGGSSFVGTIGNIVGNFSKNSATNSGGAIYNNNGMISSITGKFSENSATTDGGAIYNTGTISTITGVDDGTDEHNIIAFNNNSSDKNGGAIYNNTNSTTLMDITGDFIENSAIQDGGAIYNERGTIGCITGNFKSNSSNGDGSAIYNKSTINSIAGNFTLNSADGGAIFNDGGIIGNIAGDFTSNSSTSSYGGAIYAVGGEIGNITGDFSNNSATTGGGAIYITYAGTIGGIVGDFTSNSANDGGGAIRNHNSTIGNITGNFISNYANGNGNGGAIYNTRYNNGGIITIHAQNNKDISFNGNYVKSNTGKGGAIYNGYYESDATINLIADAGRSITFVGGSDDTVNNKYDIDGIYNESVLNINGDGTNPATMGTVNLYKVTDKSTPIGTTNIYGGQVNVAKGITQNAITVASGATLTSNGNMKVTTLTNNGTVSIYGIKGAIQNNAGGSITFNNTTDVVDVNLTNSGTVNFDGPLDIPDFKLDFKLELTQNAGTMNFSTTAIESTAAYNGEIYSFEMNGGLVNIADGSVNTLHINKLNLTGNTNFAIDADLAAEKMDKIQIHDVSGSTITEGKVININKINLLSDATQDKINISLFADDTRDVLKNNVRLKGLTYSSIYKYNASYDSETGTIGFTRTDLLNPYLYNPSVAAHTTAAMTTQIATLAMDKMDDVVHAQGRSGGDTPSSSNAWVKVMGLNDNVEFNNFNTVDSKAITVAGGFNTDKITLNNNISAAFGAYAGYIGGKQHYTDNDIDQNGGYVGLSSVFTSGNAFLTATVNGGLLNNKADNMYGNDKFRTLWLGTGLKTGYNYAITDSVVLQPNVYGGYTLVNTEDYTSASGVKIATNNLNFFEVDPGLKLSAAIADGWTGSVQGKYAIVMDNGDDITANDIALQNISTKNYIEYGIGIDKSLTDAVYLGAKINRHDGGRTGWNGSIEFRYEF